MTLICPGATLPNKTASMYGRLTPAHYSDGGITHRMIENLTGGQFVVESVAGLIHNVFEEVAPKAFLDLGWLQQKMNDLARGRFHLSGSGPALFALPSCENEYQRVANALQLYDVGVYLVNTVTRETGLGAGN